MRTYHEVNKKIHVVILSPDIYKVPTLFLDIFLVEQNSSFFKEFIF